MARTDIIVLGAGIVGISIGLHLVKRGAAVAVVDRGGPGEATSYGNTGIIEGNSLFPAAFPLDLGSLIEVALKRSPMANYHLSFLPRVAPWLIAFRAASQPERLVETARLMRPFVGRAVTEHEALSPEAGTDRYFRRTGWLKLYRSERTSAARRASWTWRQATASAMWRWTSKRRARSNRRLRRCSAAPCEMDQLFILLDLLAARAAKVCQLVFMNSASLILL